MGIVLCGVMCVCGEGEGVEGGEEEEEEEEERRKSQGEWRMDEADLRSACLESDFVYHNFRYTGRLASAKTWDRVSLRQGLKVSFRSGRTRSE